MFERSIDFFSGNALAIAVTGVVAYLLGSISFAIIITRLFGHGDIRKLGSGNAGATNVLRSVGKTAALLTTIGDLGKSVCAVLVGNLIFESIGSQKYQAESLMIYGAYIAGFFCIIGHLLPFYFGLRGGKGVLTVVGMILVIDWRVFLIEIGIFVVAMLLTRIVSLGSIAMAVFYPLVTYLIFYNLDYKDVTPGIPPKDIETVVVATVVSALIGLIILFMHRENIKRLFNGTEKHISFKNIRRKKVDG